MVIVACHRYHRYHRLAPLSTLTSPRRLHLDTLEISRDVPDIGNWIGTDSGSTGLGEGATDFCGDLTREKDAEVNSNSVVVDSTFGKLRIACMLCNSFAD